ncbi:PepSY domain-containing protein [Micromonospora echinaurantiaca]|uniref:PepSY domain-containing protein n=1 Tax=Micromonospora echinaurantiaca TaxID=47857 RepID=UPI0037211A73
MKRNSLILASLGGAAVLAVTGVAVGAAVADEGQAGRTALAAATTAPSTAATPDDDPTGATPGTPGTTGGTPGTTAPATSADAVSQQRAGEIALASAGGGRITEIEAEQEHGRPVWSVEIVAGQTEHEVDVDRETGAVVKAEQEPVDDDGDDDSDDGSDDDRDDDSDDDDDDDDRDDD